MAKRILFCLTFFTLISCSTQFIENDPLLIPPIFEIDYKNYRKEVELKEKQEKEREKIDKKQNKNKQKSIKK